MTSVLDYINRVRWVQRKRELGALPLPDGTLSCSVTTVTVAEDQHSLCVVEHALGLAVDTVEPNPRAHEDAESGAIWVLRALDQATAEGIAKTTQMPWRASPPEVQVPDPVIDLMVAQYFEVVVGDGVGFVRGWWIPDDAGFPMFVTPHQSILELYPGNEGPSTQTDGWNQ